MKDFKRYLISKNIVSKKQLHYYLNWIAQFYAFCQADIGTAVESEQITQYLKQLSKNLEDWQVQQASDAINLYFFYLRRKAVLENTVEAGPADLWKLRADEMVKILRLKHRATSTEKTYMASIYKPHRDDLSYRLRLRPSAFYP